MISFRTISGRLIDLENPEPEAIEIYDVACGLSHCCRFSGQISAFYSVAQHSILVAQLVDPPLAQAALLHDASEAYLGDLSRNLKHHPLLAGYRQLEERLQRVIERRLLGDVVRDRERQLIKHADNLAVIFERAVVRHRGWEGRPTAISALAEGYVNSQEPEEILRLLPRLPRHFPIYPPAAARDLFGQLYTLGVGTIERILDR